ncbi:hypothetical protein [Sediminicola luteus]|uniref:Uncharacterized protein n=1 Tax=Sediminicola luteus TaxID=319238 RepID=A0A2A4G4J0_9FLAO|nr:hypothetical protein [Sediminicola luteus]PCE62896.1 hypothetical protein B7P33_16605 [Sediminicola luteus]
MNQTEYLDFLEEKFGKSITEIMLNKETTNLSLTDGLACKVYCHNKEQEIKNKIKEFTQNKRSIISETLIDNEVWAFDFPSWTGELDFNKQHIKEIMVIGMEPHIRDRFFQATYGLRETKKNEFHEIDEGANKNLWNNLNSLFGNKKDYKVRDFLDKFYVTDLSHFAIKGEAKEILKVKD